MIEMIKLKLLHYPQRFYFITALHLFLYAVNGATSPAEAQVREILVTDSAISIGEGLSYPQEVSLKTQPTADVIIDVTVVNAQLLTTTPTSLTFTPDNWNVAQRLNITPVDDDIFNGYTQRTTITLTARQGGYDNVQTVISVTVYDDDPTSLTVTEGTTRQFRGLGLGLRQGETRIVVTLRSSNTNLVTVSPSSLTFTQENYRNEQGELVRQPFAFNILDNDLLGDQTATISFEFSPQNYRALAGFLLTITDNDRGVSLSTNPNPVTEGSDVTVTATLSKALADTMGTMPVTIPVTITAGTAESGDFGSLASITIARAQSSGTGIISTTNDAVDEDNETFSVELGTLPMGFLAGSPNSVGVTITDNDTKGVTVSPTSVTVTEAAGDDHTATYTVVLTSQPTGSVTVAVASDDTDIATVDKSTLTFSTSTWSTAQTVTVTGVDNNIDDGTSRSATITHTVSGADYASVEASDVSVTVTDDDTAPAFSIGDVSVTEGSAAMFTVTRNGATGTTASVKWNTANDASGTDPAEANDYTAQTSKQTLNFAIGDALKTFTVQTTNDAVDEGDETFLVQLSEASAGTSITDAEVTGMIMDDDTKGITVTPTTLTIDEGNSETYTVVLTSQPTEAVKVGITISGDNDITVQKQALTFTTNNWDDAQTVTVKVAEDADATAGTATISHSVTSGGDYAGMRASSVSVTERDKDSGSTQVTLRVFPSSVSESSSGQIVTVTGTLDGGTRSDATTVTVSVSGGSASASDFAPVPDFTLMVASDQTSGSATFTLSPVADAIDEADETVRISGIATGLTVIGTTATIVDNDDPEVTVSYEKANYEIIEGGNAVQVTVLLSADIERRVGIPLVVTHDNGATDADYSGVPEQVVFDRGETKKTFDLIATDDDLDDDDETITLSFGKLPDQVNMGSPSAVTIIDNNERGVVVSVAALAIAENSTKTYTVVLSSAPTAPVTLQISGMENIDMSVSQIIFTAENWNIPQEVVVHAHADNDAIVDDGMILHHAISGGDYDEVVVAPVAVTIIEKDVPVLRIEDQLVREDAGEMVFTATLNIQSSQEVRVSYATSNLTADAGKDYEATQGTLHFAALQTQQMFSVPIINDDLDEGDETFTVILSTPMHVTISGGNTRVFGTIEEDDTLPQAMELLLSSVGRMVATQTVDIISRGFEDRQSGIRPSFTLGGRPLALYDTKEKWHAVAGLMHNFAAALGADIWMPSLAQGPEPGRSTGIMPLLGGAGQFDDMETLRDSPLRLRRVTPREVLSRSDFELPLNRSDNSNGWTLWGQGAENEISGQPNIARRIKANSFSGYLGIDYRFRTNTLVGLALTHSVGNLNYNRGANHTLVPFDYSLTSLMPYAHYQMNPKLGFWGLMGLGRGNVDVKHDEEIFKTPLTLLMGAAGARRDLTTYRRVDLAMKTDAFFATVASGAHTSLPEMRENVERVRVLIEGRKKHEVGSSSQFIQSVEFGGRWDQGRVVSGAGLDVGGGVEYAHTRGLGLAARGRYLLVHEQAGYKEWGTSLALRADPGWGKRGLLLSVAPVWGVSSQSAGAMWDNTSNLGGGSAYRSSYAPGIKPDHTEVKLGYRFIRHARGALIEPYSDLSLDRQGWQRYRVGGRIELDERINVNFEGTRNAQGQTTIQLRAYLIW